jgi:hypothetical protein
VDNVVDRDHALLHSVAGILAFSGSVGADVDVGTFFDGEHTAVDFVGDIIDFFDVKGVRDDFVAWGC